MTSIAFTGDIAFDEFFEGAYQNPELVDESIFEFLAGADHVVANIEGPITEYESVRESLFVHKQDPEALVFLKNRLSVDIAFLANNHVRDNGHVGVKDSIENLKRAGMTGIGIGDSLSDYEATCIVGEDVKVGILAVAQPWWYASLAPARSGVFSWNRVKHITKLIKQMRKDGAEYVVAVVHGGKEFLALPCPYVREAYKDLIKLGVDCIVAHHPHVVENYEIIDGKYVFYSLGNFIFDTEYQRAHQHTEEGLLLKLIFSHDGISFVPMGTRIDRDRARVVSGEVPAIFTELNEREWTELWPIQAVTGLKTEIRSKKAFFNAQKGKSSLQVLMFLYGLRKKKIQQKDIFDGVWKSFTQKWRFTSRKDILNYIRK